MLSVIYADYHIQANYAVCHCAKCCYAECVNAEKHYAEFQSVFCTFGERNAAVFETTLKSNFV